MIARGKVNHSVFVCGGCADSCLRSAFLHFMINRLENDSIESWPPADAMVTLAATAAPAIRQGLCSLSVSVSLLLLVIETFAGLRCTCLA